MGNSVVERVELSTLKQASPEGTVRAVGCYFVEGYWRSYTRTGPPGKVGAYHRTLSTYINAPTDAGLTPERMSEQRAGGDIAAAPYLSGLSRPVWAQVPAVLVGRCRKAAADHHA
jgi:hypothetical protein